MGKKIVEFIKKYKLHILGLLLFIFIVRSCSNSGKITKLERINNVQEKLIDSLTIINESQIVLLKNETLNQLK
jgi:hypothetical protein